ncbi:MAG: hypothetical protein DRO13_04695 [Thermoprotei archaeon]|nr:MAG: hypothetical protein DRO13_04695 [Thermoprotei archaeon]
MAINPLANSIRADRNTKALYPRKGINAPAADPNDYGIPYIGTYSLENRCNSHSERRISGEALYQYLNNDA